MLIAPRRLDRLAEFFCRHNAKCLQNCCGGVRVASETTDCKFCLDQTRFVPRLGPTVAPVKENLSHHDDSSNFNDTSSKHHNTTNFESDQLHDVPDFDLTNLPTQSACQGPTPPSDSTHSIQPQITTSPKRKPSSEARRAFVWTLHRKRDSQRNVATTACFGNGNEQNGGIASPPSPSRSWPFESPARRLVEMSPSIASRGRFSDNVQPSQQRHSLESSFRIFHPLFMHWKERNTKNPRRDSSSLRFPPM